MITSLSIENFALIEKLAINFTSGFSIITGETGAGKSILLGALGLVLGKRADLSSLKNKEEKCIIEGHFQLSKYNLKSFFEANDIDYDDDTIIRREILPSGKSRAFVNDSPVNLQVLQDLSSYLIDIHSQHQTQELADENFQFEIIDAISKNQELIAKYRLILKQYKNDLVALSNLKSKLESLQKEQDYNTFLLEELLLAKLKSGEQEALESEYEQLNNVEFIKENLDKSLILSNEEEFGILQNLKEVKFALQKNAAFSMDYNSIFERIESVSIEFQDVINEMRRLSENLFNDPERLDFVNQKLQMVYNLQKKHQVTSVEELLEVQANIENKVISVGTLESDIRSLEENLSHSVIKLDALALSIRESRLKSAPLLASKLIAILEQLGMPHVRFNMAINESENYLANGKDELQFLFSANKGSDFGLLKKVASGGEMSRIMLATKAVLAQYSKLPTIIFDEIDTGVSGEIANKMGDILFEMSQNMQVFAITHLPQIAAKGKVHFKVFKVTENEQTQTELKLLTSDERVTEIAQMLSGTVVTDSALNHAKALLN